MKCFPLGLLWCSHTQCVSNCYVVCLKACGAACHLQWHWYSEAVKAFVCGTMGRSQLCLKDTFWNMKSPSRKKSWILKTANIWQPGDSLIYPGSYPQELCFKAFEEHPITVPQMFDVSLLLVPGPADDIDLQSLWRPITTWAQWLKKCVCNLRFAPAGVGLCCAAPVPCKLQWLMGIIRLGWIDFPENRANKRLCYVLILFQAKC